MTLNPTSLSWVPGVATLACEWPLTWGGLSLSSAHTSTRQATGAAQVRCAALKASGPQAEVECAARVPSSSGRQGEGKPYWATPAGQPLRFTIGTGQVSALGTF